MIPLVHDFEGETVLVVGGGPVGARKSRRFAREATVVVISPSFADREFGDVQRVRATLEPEDVEVWLRRADPALVVAATDDTPLNEAIEDAAREQGVLVNRADVSGGREAGSVVVPATIRDGPVVVAVSTGGESPALSRHLREELESELAGAGEMAKLASDLRTELQTAGYDAETRRAALSAVIRSSEVWTALDTPGTNTREKAAEVIAGETT